MNIQDIIKCANRFKTEAHNIFSTVEGAKSAIITLEISRERLDALSLRQEELLRDALKCIERDVPRASIVLAWTAFMDFLEEKISEDGLKTIHKAYPKWKKYKTIGELKDWISDYQLIEAGKKIGFLTKNETKTIHGLLSKRNECAHPGDYCPRYHEPLGYIDEILNRIEYLIDRKVS